ncbi:MAG: hypothetical protein KAH01_03750 [Caldisericia bacterium]|nr:hypothetical protein [Caldisericia bacterium]
MSDTKADDGFVQLKSVTIVEDFYSREYWNEDLLVSRLIDIEGVDKFVKLNMPLFPNDSSIIDETALSENEVRLSFENVNYIPWLVANGLIKNDHENTNDNVRNIILEGIDNQKEYCSIFLKKINNNMFELMIKGIDEKLNLYKKLNLNVIILEDWVNCDFTFKDWIYEHKTTLRYIPRNYPFGATGKGIKLTNGNTKVEKLTISVPKNTYNKCYIVAFIQDQFTKEIVSSGITKLSNEEKQSYFNWNHWPKCTFKSEIGDIPEKTEMLYVKNTGLDEMAFSVSDACDLKYLSFEISYTDANCYRILGAVLNKNIKVEKFQFDKNTTKITIVFQEPLNGNHDIFSFITHFKKGNLKKSCSFQVKNFEALNSDYNSVFYCVNDIVRRYPVRLIIDNNQYDFDNDSWINNFDLDLLVEHFGTSKNDTLYNDKYNICNTGFSKDRVDIEDLLVILSEIKKQEYFLSLTK